MSRQDPTEPRQRFPRRLRITRRGEFLRVLERGVRVADRRLLVRLYPNGLGYSRLGLIVGRRHGPAVRRNRLKRLLREAFRLSQHELPAGFDIVCSPQKDAGDELRPLRASLVRLVRRAAARCPVATPARGGEEDSDG